MVIFPLLPPLISIIFSHLSISSFFSFLSLHLCFTLSVLCCHPPSSVPPSLLPHPAIPPLLSPPLPSPSIPLSTSSYPFFHFLIPPSASLSCFSVPFVPALSSLPLHFCLSLPSSLPLLDIPLTLLSLTSPLSPSLFLSPSVT